MYIVASCEPAQRQELANDKIQVEIKTLADSTSGDSLRNKRLGRGTTENVPPVARFPGFESRV